MDIRTEHLSFSYARGPAVLKDVSLEFPRGRVTSIFGPNGCGKSTLLKCLNASLKPCGGNVFIGGEAAGSLTPGQVASRVAVVPQDTPADINFTVREMVMFGRYAHGSILDDYNGEDRRITDAALERLGISSLGARRFCDLSGGERQNVVLARAIAQNCDIMLFDEPDTHLDIAHRLALYKLIGELAAEGKTIIFVCHDIFIAPMFIDNAVLISKGEVAAWGKRDQVLTHRNIAEVFGASINITRPDSHSFSCSI
jgi:iron complex transport system ATP-binding protein